MSGIERYLKKPEDCLPSDEPIDTDVIDFGRGNIIGKMMMPGITIHGRNYEMAYEEMSEAALKGIPVHRDGKPIGYVDMDYKGQGKVHLNPGETLDLDTEGTVTFSVGKTLFGAHLEEVMLDQINHDFRKILELPPMDTSE